jgi:acetyl-CoA carboxylase biotin carboxyl carrier protein
VTDQSKGQAFSVSEPTVEDAQAILEQFEHSDWDELHIDAPGFQLHVFKSPGKRRSSAPSTSALQPAPPPPVDAPPQVSTTTPATATSPPSTENREAAAVDLVAVRAPNLGTFYRAPKPGAEPFVQVGQQVEPSTDVCIIEVMKLFTTVQAGVKGTVREILVGDTDLVEYDQPLVLIEPSGP